LKSDSPQVVKDMWNAILEDMWMWMVVWGKQRCLSPDSEILTSEGVVPLRDCINKKRLLVLSDYKGTLIWNPAIPIRSEKRLLYDVKTGQGTFLASEDHYFRTPFGWKALRELEIGNKLLYIAKPQTKDGIHYDGMQTMWKSFPTQQGINPVLFNLMQEHLRKSQTPELDADIEPKTIQISDGILQNASTLHEGSIQESFNEDLRMVWQTIPRLSNEKILWQELRNQIPQFYLRQPRNQTASTGKATESPKGTIFSYTIEGKKKINPESTSKYGSEFSWRMDKKITEPKTHVKNVEGLLFGAPREAYKQIIAKRQNDEARKNNKRGFRNAKFNLCMEQGYTIRGASSFSGFFNYRNKHYNRMSRKLLAYRRGYNRKGRIIQEKRLRTNHANGKNYSNRSQIRYNTTTILAIEKSSTDRTCDLIVPNANNFFLANGILVHNSGKTTVQMQLAYSVYKDWDKVLNSFVFNLSGLLYKMDKGQPEKILTRNMFHNRIPLLIYDDWGGSSNKAQTQYDRAWDIFKGGFDLLGTKVAIIIASMVDPSEPTFQLQQKYTHEIFVPSRGVYKYDAVDWQQDYRGWRPKRKKDWIETQKFNPVPDDVYKQYDEMRMALVDEVEQRIRDAISETQTEYILKRITPKDIQLLELIQSRGPTKSEMVKKEIGADTKEILVRCKARNLVVPIRMSDHYYKYDLTALGYSILESLDKRDTPASSLLKKQTKEQSKTA